MPMSRWKRLAGRKPARGQQPGVLQVALAPAPVALGAVDQRRRPLLVAALDVVGEPHRPAGLAHERGLDEVVARGSGRRRARCPGRSGQRAVLHERLHADDGVVPPVVALVLLPVVEAGEEERAVEPVGERLQARVERTRRRRSAARSG